ncbi:TrkH family potassium uptake protein [Enterococcus dispar]|uniref:Trk system potassium uptake protein TrkH n=1 Tax=Enterococcus dispar ATCC 51266 TaxID=1139219 RepID=S1NH35_9ENTE|nr:TrkH family potassium uptake protein [Enterococcus dispar]EOT43499.1 trk system potassium uptake protein TrkH [Enterococcus dispar ATCC 51266]EOW85053.1 trk system potassium uptake protein TrkH [Enterococcus dispar ATCC 51266]MCU7358262.1 TrkH family potassium uptake protein [Enterococcus dispar]MDT2706422.1 TrkH family potassium uptake protein [Enterococcus dispar]WCG33384.1 TrkH family potassium uptake protein [Enterococcus dispar]
MKQLKKGHLATPQLISLGFATVILCGALLLMLPISSRSGGVTPFIDALFTATSATCVTGLTTVNTAQHWTPFGQFVILVMIETGGLGFMSLPVFFFMIARKKINLRTRMILKDSLNLEQMNGSVNLMRYILLTSVIIQGLGSIALSFSFVPQYGWLKGIWFSIFHSVSSFCNAGFDLLGDSLANNQQDIWMLSVIMILIIAGGLGFLVWFDLIQYRKQKRLSIHSKIALLMTGSLLILGAIGFYLTEHNGQLLVTGNWLQRFFNTMFMAVTPRTAGYYSVNYFEMSHAGLILTIVLMYIGGTSGSTAGGLKTTTFGVLLIQMKSILKGRNRAEFSGRTIPAGAIFRALTLFFITLSLCILATMILSVTEKIPDVDGLGLEYIVFEVVSAFGTVGLTMGLTPELSIVGKVIIISLMFIGRVGIMTVLLSLIAKARQQEQHFKYPEESVLIG